MDKHWIVCWHKEANKSHSYLAYSSIELAADVYKKLGAKGYEVSIAAIFESNVYESHPNFKLKEVETSNYLLMAKDLKDDNGNASIGEIFEDNNKLIDEFFKNTRTTSEILEEEFKQRAEDLKKNAITAQIEALVGKARKRSWYGIKDAD